MGQRWGQRWGQRCQGPAQAFSPERDPSSRRGILHPEPVFASLCLPASPQRPALPPGDIGCPQGRLREAPGALECPCSVSHQSSPETPARWQVSSAGGSRVPAPSRCVPAKAGAPVAGQGRWRCGGPEPARFPAEDCRGHVSAAPCATVQPVPRWPKGRVPSWGPWGSDGEGALPQSGCPEPAAFRKEATPDRAGGAGSGFLYKRPQIWQDPPGIPDSEGSPNPMEVPRTCWVPQPHCVPPQSATSVHTLDPDPAGSFKQHNPQGCSPHQIPQGTPRSPDPAGSPGVP